MTEHTIKITNGWSLGFWIISGASAFFVLTMLTATLIGPTINNLRSTDATDGGKQDRSGLSVFTDRGTGCQYVSGGGSMTPRLGRDRQPMCGAPQ